MISRNKDCKFYHKTQFWRFCRIWLRICCQFLIIKLIFWCTSDCSTFNHILPSSLNWVCQTQRCTKSNRLLSKEMWQPFWLKMIACTSSTWHWTNALAKLCLALSTKTLKISSGSRTKKSQLWQYGVRQASDFAMFSKILAPRTSIHFKPKTFKFGRVASNATSNGSVLQETFNIFAKMTKNQDFWQLI